MTEPLRRFTATQRLLHWVMAVCILAMLFIGVGMESTVMPKYQYASGVTRQASRKG